MAKPFIQIDDLLREMTEEEYEGLLASGWTEAPAVEENATQEEVAIVEEPVDDLVEGEQP